MQLDSLIPRDLITLLYVAVATSIGWVGGWITRRKREPVELEKLRADTHKTSAEARQIHASTDLSLIQAATTALTNAERLRQERDHWQLKAFDLEVELKEVRQGHGQLVLEVQSMDYQMRKQMAFIRAEGMEAKYVALDKPATDPPDGVEG